LPRLSGAAIPFELGHQAVLPNESVCHHATDGFGVDQQRFFAREMLGNDGEDESLEGEQLAAMERSRSK
jgi:hypothetical protein